MTALRLLCSISVGFCLLFCLLAAGCGPDVLVSIDMVGSDLGFQVGTCGKDGQGVPVSDAQPTLRIPSLVVGGQGQPQDG